MTLHVKIHNQTTNLKVKIVLIKMIDPSMLNFLASFMSMAYSLLTIIQMHIAQIGCSIKV